MKVWTFNWRRCGFGLCFSSSRIGFAFIVMIYILLI
jgi:hypothetical protein